MPILKAVIDTNIMVSVAFAREGLTKKLKDRIADRDFLLITSKAILKELYEVLNYPHIVERFNASKKDINDFMGMIIEYAAITSGDYSIENITEDPKDDMFIACALEGNADYIVTRDPHLRNIKHFQCIQIIDLTTFMNKIENK